MAITLDEILAITPELRLVARVDLWFDADDNGIAEVGDVLRYTYTLTNTSDATLTGVSVSDELSTALGQELLLVDDDLGDGFDVLAPGAVQIAQFDYTLGVGDLGAVVANTVVVVTAQTAPLDAATNVDVPVQDLVLTAPPGGGTLEGGPGNDVLIAGTGPDVLLGGAGDDLLIANLGADVYDGGPGNDTIDISYTSQNGVIVDLAAGNLRFPLGTVKPLISIENVIGSGGNDIIIGNDEDNVFRGGGGNDVIQGGGGDDVAIVGPGSDTFTGGTGSDTLRLISLPTGQPHTFTDFNPMVDVIDLKELFGAAGDAITAANLASYVRIATVGGSSVLQIDVSGSGTGFVDAIALPAGLSSADLSLGANLLVNDQPLMPNPALTISSSLGLIDVDGNGSPNPGDRILYSYTVTNTGNVPLTNVAVAATLAGGVFATLPSLAVGASETVTFEYTLVSGNVGTTVSNTATVDSAQTDPVQALPNLVILGTNTAQTHNGGPGDDIIWGAGGNDTLNGGGGNDLLIGGAGFDFYDGGSGSNTISYAWSPSEWHVTLLPGGAGFSTRVAYVNVGSNGPQDYVTSVIHEQMVNVQNFIGNSTNNIFTGNEQANTFTGNGGSRNVFQVTQLTPDTIDEFTDFRISSAQGGLDTIIFYNVVNVPGHTITNADRPNFMRVEQIDGKTLLSINPEGNGNDGTFIPTMWLPAGISLNNLGIGTRVFFVGNGVLDGERIYGTSGNDTLVGTQGGDTMFGFDGNDTLMGVAGNNTLVASFGTDKLIGGSGDDWLVANWQQKGWDALDVRYMELPKVYDGGGGSNNTLDFSLSQDYRVSVSLEGGFAVEGHFRVMAPQGIHAEVKNIQNVVGSGGIDYIRGNHENNILDGGGGSDFIYGVSGDNILLGGAGNDVIAPGFGNNIVDGGTGTDTVDYFFDFADGAVIDLSEGLATFADGRQDILISIERVNGPNGNATIIGNDETNILRGNSGDDVIVARNGNDTLWGDGGDDTFLFDRQVSGTKTIGDWGLGNDVVDLSGFLADAGKTWQDVIIGHGPQNTTLTIAGIDDFGIDFLKSAAEQFDLSDLEQGIIRASTPTIKMIPYVPSYEWVFSCETIAAGAVFAYWDMHGYPNLFEAAGWEELRVTENITHEMTSPEYFAAYGPHRLFRDPELIEAAADSQSISDFFATHQGWSDYPWRFPANKLTSDIMVEFAASRGYNFNAYQDWGYLNITSDNKDTLWDRFTFQIDNDRPVFLGITGHTQVVFGYAESGDGSRWYAHYNGSSTRSLIYGETEHVIWSRFDEDSSNLEYMVFMAPADPPSEFII